MEIFDINTWWLLVLIIVLFTFAYKKLTRNPDAITSKFVARKKVQGNPEQNLRIIKEASKNAGFRKVGFDEERSRFYAQTSFSMSSFLEYIDVSFTQDNFFTELEFKSICALPTQIIDWGKNKRNFNKFERELEKLIPRSVN
ncbi:hypothetical protein [Algoriphagus sp.]|uniref:hypothetical protein n=1 Tax=Algoriphagus sp. TaxID=1872435 RepID=UPI00391CE22F